MSLHWESHFETEICGKGPAARWRLVDGKSLKFDGD